METSKLVDFFSTFGKEPKTDIDAKLITQNIFDDDVSFEVEKLP